MPRGSGLAIIIRSCLHFCVVAKSFFFTRLFSHDIRGAYDKFPDFFVWAFKIVIDS